MGRYTPHDAAAEGDVMCVEELLRKGENPNARRDG